ncbi:MAG: type VI secretion system-associated protein TagO, partial [Saezia sp.]
MKRLLLAFFIFVGCNHVNAQGASDVSIEKALEACTKIASSLERLNCFDQVAQTPVILSQQTAVTKPSAQSVQIIDFVKENEAMRVQGDMSFIRSEKPEFDTDGRDIGTQMIISAPGLDKNPINPRVYLAVSCILNIT